MIIFEKIQFSIFWAMKNPLKSPKMADFSQNIDFQTQLSL